MQEKQERFEGCIAKIKARKTAVETKLSLHKKPHYPFFTKDPTDNKLAKMEELLVHLEKYQASTNALIAKDLENIAFYTTHFEAVIQLLEKIENAEPSKLTPTDFTLVLPQIVDYKKSYWDKLYEIYLFSTYTGGIGAIALAVVCGLLGAIVGFLIGVIIGGCIGFLAGIVIAPFMDITPYLHDYDKPYNFQYVNGDIFNCYLLREAYEEAYQEAGCANVEVIRQGLLNAI